MNPQLFNNEHGDYVTVFICDYTIVVSLYHKIENRYGTEKIEFGGLNTFKIWEEEEAIKLAKELVGKE